MAESSILFEGTINTERFSNMIGDIARNGLASEGGMLRVTATGSVMQVNVATGGAFIGHNRGTVAQRRHYLNDATVTLAIPAANATNPRIDRVLLLLNVNETNVADKCKLVIAEGTPAASPVPPPISDYRSGARYALSLAQVRVNAGVTAIGNAAITDEREDPTVCGFFNQASRLRLFGVDNTTHRTLWLERTAGQTGSLLYIGKEDGSLLVKMDPDGRVFADTSVPDAGLAMNEALSYYDGSNQRIGGVVFYKHRYTAAPTVTTTSFTSLLDGGVTSAGATLNVFSSTTWGFEWRASVAGTSRMGRARFLWSIG